MAKLGERRLARGCVVHDIILGFGHTFIPFPPPPADATDAMHSCKMNSEKINMIAGITLPWGIEFFLLLLPIYNISLCLHAVSLYDYYYIYNKGEVWANNKYLMMN